MFRIIKDILKGKVKMTLGRTLSGAERFLLTSLFSKIDRVATLLVPSNVHPQLLDPDYDFVRLTNNVEANLELFTILRERFPNVDAAMPASWLGLAGMGQVEMGTTMRITPMVEPSPDIYALEKMSLEELELPKMEGFLKNQIELCVEIQDRYPEMTSPPIIEGSFDLAILLRGEKLFNDFILYKNFVNATDSDKKEKIKKKGDPTFFPRIMDFATEASIHIGKMYKEQGINMLGVVIVNQYANPPIMSPNDFITYIYPYVETVWREFKKYRATAGYMPPSPTVANEIISYPALSGIACFNNYMFPQNEIGLTPDAYDEEMIHLSKELKTPYQHLIHGKFLRDGTNEEIEAHVKKVCELAVENKVPMGLGIAAVPLGTDLTKIDLILNSVGKYGVYE
ncbi:MAG: uroporphyrinogen decarboxylase family protein [Candidatus Lokiarchaeia archaeon]